MTEIGCSWVTTTRPVASVAMHDVALIDEPDAGPAGERRGNRRVVELGFRAVDRRLIASDLRLELGYRGALRIDCCCGAK